MYRHPGVLAKIVTTLDVLSGGRARLGIGASWYEREQRGWGDRWFRSVNGSSGWRRRCGSACRCGARTTACSTVGLPVGRDAVCARADQPAAPADHDRRRWRAEDVAAGGALRRRLQCVRHHPAEVDLLREHCAAEDRDNDSIEKTVPVTRPALADVDAFVADLAEYAALGATEVQTMPDRHPVEFAEQLAEQVVPRVSALG